MNGEAWIRVSGGMSFLIFTSSKAELFLRSLQQLLQLHVTLVQHDGCQGWP